MTCDSQHRHSGLKCGLKPGHPGDHVATCYLRHCGGYKSQHVWPR